MVTKLELNYNLKARVKWVTILGKPKLINNALFNAIDILLYDIDVRI